MAAKAMHGNRRGGGVFYSPNMNHLNIIDAEKALRVSMPTERDLGVFTVDISYSAV
jgi:hypothetical protein